MKTTIFYLTSDFVASEEFLIMFLEGKQNDVDFLKELCVEGKAEHYDIENFVLAFNDEKISDLGYLIYA
jgi:cob(I)alamin adenosyltransferase